MYFRLKLANIEITQGDNYANCWDEIFYSFSVAMY